MKFDPTTHHRRSIRLKDYDYSQCGAYFVTIVTWQRAYLFGEIVDGKMKANDAGILVQTEWKKLCTRFPGTYTEDFVVMPDHMHAIIVLDPADGKSRLLGTIIGSYKSTVARLINGLRHTQGAPVWQRNYYERIIRDEKEFINFRNYIEDNPRRWWEDQVSLSRLP